MLVCISLHALMPFLKLIVFRSELDRWVCDVDLDSVFIKLIVLRAAQVRIILQLTFENVEVRVAVVDLLCWLGHLCSDQGLSSRRAGVGGYRLLSW